MKSDPTRVAATSAGTAIAAGHQGHDQRTPKAEIEQGRIHLFHPPHDPYIAMRRIAVRSEHERAKHRHHRHRQQQGRGDRRDHRGREWLIHPSLDTRHPEQRQKHSDDDGRREGDRPANLHRRLNGGLAFAARSPCRRGDGRCSP